MGGGGSSASGDPFRHCAVKPARPKYQRHRGTGFAGPLEASPSGGRRAAPQGGTYFNQPRLRKYHMGPSALATINATT